MKDLVNLFMNKTPNHATRMDSNTNRRSVRSSASRPKVSTAPLTEKERQIHSLLSKTDQRTAFGLGIKKALDKKSPRAFRELMLDIKSLAKENLISVNEWVGKEAVTLILEL